MDMETEITLSTSILDLYERRKVSARFLNCMMSIPNISTLGDLLYSKRTDRDWLGFPKMGRKTLFELKEVKNAYAYLLETALLYPTYEDVFEAYRKFRTVYEEFLLNSRNNPKSIMQLDKQIAMDSLIYTLC